MLWPQRLCLKQFHLVFGNSNYLNKYQIISILLKFFGIHVTGITEWILDFLYSFIWHWNANKSYTLLFEYSVSCGKVVQSTEIHNYNWISIKLYADCDCMETSCPINNYINGVLTHLVAVLFYHSQCNCHWNGKC